MRRLRVLVVEDSLTVRKRLVAIFASDPEIEVVGEAENGQEAINLCRDLRPDLLTLDMVLPGIDGLATTEYVMAHFPTPILVVSASTNRGELFRTYDALAAGAVDVLEKPTGDCTDEAWDRRLLSTAKLVARVRVITHPRARLGALSVRPTRDSAPTEPLPTKVVALGASTGGPGAVVEVLRALPADFPLPLLVVIHIGETFGAAFAEWLDGQSRLRAGYARDGEALSGAKGRVVLAPPGTHLVVRDGHLRLTVDAERHGCRPSVDTLFESVACELGKASVGCLLTGMGRDGAAGLLAIRRAGGLTIAQDEASSVVWGMPREAVRLAAAARVVPLRAIGPALAKVADRRPA